MQATRVIYRLVSQTNSLRHPSHSSYQNAYCTLSSSVARPRCLQHLVKSAVYYSQSTEQQRTVRILFISDNSCLSIHYRRVRSWYLFLFMGVSIISNRIVHQLSTPFIDIQMRRVHWFNKKKLLLKLVSSQNPRLRHTLIERWMIKIRWKFVKCSRLNQPALGFGCWSCDALDDFVCRLIFKCGDDDNLIDISIVFYKIDWCLDHFHLRSLHQNVFK